ncbi:hypothetical protein EC988_002376, partial [Linderina pennispora]
MDDPNYDEFGNYIGPDLGSSSSEEESDSEVELAEPAAGMSGGNGSEGDNASEQGSDDDADADEPNRHMMIQRVDAAMNQIVLHEDKKYYPEAEEVYGPDVEALVQEEDTQPLTEPIIAPLKTRKFQVAEEDELPDTAYTKEFLVDLQGYPAMIRNVVVAGHLHHGKTSVVDLLVASTHEWKDWDTATPRATPTAKMAKPNDKAFGYTDVHQLERRRMISLKSMPVSLVAQNTKGKSLALNIMDSPGHVNFIDEVVAAMRLSDGVVLVVDVVEGVMTNTERIIQLAVREQLPITLVVNKVDRLVLELKLPPADAYYKLKLTIEEVNKAIAACPLAKPEMRVSPELGNVCFASSSYGWCFSLESFAQQYVAKWDMPVRARDLAKRLWGDVYYHPQRRTFMRKQNAAHGKEAKRSFLHFILEPLYKMFAQVVGEDEPALRPVVESLGIKLRKEDYALDVHDLLRRVMTQFFGPPTGLVDMCETHIPSPAANAERKTMSLYTGQMDTETAQAMRQCDADGPLVIAVAKQYPSSDASQFFALGRIFSGHVSVGQNVRVLGEGYSPGDDEDMAIATVTDAWV